MVGKVSASVVFIHPRIFELIGKRKFHYPISKRQASLQYEMLGCRLTFFILHEESHLVVLLLEVLDILVHLARMTMMGLAMMGLLMMRFLIIRLLCLSLCLVGSFVGRALFTLGKRMVTTVDIASFFSQTA